MNLTYINSIQLSQVYLRIISENTMDGIYEALKSGGVGAVIGLALIPCVLLIVSCLGFTSKGIAAGSYAALTQSSLGNVSFASSFALIQSATSRPAIFLNAIAVFTIVGFVLGVGSFYANIDIAKHLQQLQGKIKWQIEKLFVIGIQALKVGIFGAAAVLSILLCLMIPLKCLFSTSLGLKLSSIPSFVFLGFLGGLVHHFMMKNI